MISRRRFIYSAATGLMMPVLHAGLPLPLSFFKPPCRSSAEQAALTDWVVRVQGQSSDVSPGAQQLVGCYIDGLMTDGVWSKIVRHSVYVGNALAALNAPLKNGGASATDGLVNFVGGDYNQAAGLTGNGLNTVNNIGLDADSALMGDNNIHIGVYIRSAAGGHAMGAYNGTLGDNILVASAGTTYYNANNDTTAQASFADAVSFGFYLGTRTSSSLSTIYLNAVSKATNTNAGGSRPALKLFVHALNFNGSSFGSTSQTIEHYTAGTSLGATDVANFAARYATLRAGLGR